MSVFLMPHDARMTLSWHDICGLQGDGGWDLLAALDSVRNRADQNQEQHSLKAVEFLDRRVRKVSAYTVHRGHQKGSRSTPLSPQMGLPGVVRFMNADTSLSSHD